MTLKFTGWGCKGIDSEGLEVDLEMASFPDLEKMVEEAYKNDEVESLRIFKCYSDWQELRPNEEPKDFPELEDCETEVKDGK